MTTTESVEGTARRGRRNVAVFCLAWTLVVGCLVLIGTLFVAGERVTPYDELSAAVAAGEVDEIRVAGGLGDGQVRGFALAEIYWSKGAVPRVSQVFESTRRGLVHSQDVPSVQGRVDEQLAALNPDLQATRAGELSTGSRFEFSIGTPREPGWQVPAWTGLLGLAMLIGLLGLIIGGPEPRRATRWAWFWLLGIAPPLGALAFLLLGGSTSRWPTPAPREGRLTGGWAFLIAFLVGSALSTTAAFTF